MLKCSKKHAAIIALVLSALALWHWRGFVILLFCEDPLIPVQQRFSSGGAIVDRNNNLLRVIADQRGDICLYTPLASHSADLIKTVILVEDKNFYSHSGVDLSAITRAVWQNVSNNRIISGASTITQQLIRITKPRPRTFAVKTSEALLASALEVKLSKDRILEYYLNGVSLFGNVRGIALAALLLFDKSPSMLNLAESACLAAAIQAPGRYDPFTKKGNHLLAKRRNRVLGELLKNKLCTKAEYENAIKEIIPGYRHKMPFNAPHFCDMVQAENPGLAGVKTSTIDIRLQNHLYQTLKAHSARLGKRDAFQAAAMIADARTMEILAMCGSIEYSKLNSGFNNACLAKRSGGSVLKPFLYALAFDRGYYPSYVIPDTIQTFKTPQGDYMPSNADRRSYGPVTIRHALGNSLNISAIKMLNMLGIDEFYSMLIDLEILPPRDSASDFYGLGLAVGNPEIDMRSIVQAYGIFVNGGNFKTLKYLSGQPQKEHSVISEQSAFLTFDVISDFTARLFTFGNPAFFKSRSPVGIKTGTSTDYRDCWLAGVNSEYIIAVWVGNFNGKPTQHLSGAGACGPIYKNIIDFLDRYKPGRPVRKPDGVRREAVCSVSGELVGPFCPNHGYDYFADCSQMPEICSFHKSYEAVHELPAAYAGWLRDRRQHFDADPFKLSGNLSIPDPWSLPGVGKEVVEASAASGPIYIGRDTNDASWNNISIISPHDGDRLVMSNAHENYALLRALPAAPVEEIVWMIDGEEYIRTSPPYEAYWLLEAGQHRISALTAGQVAAEITVFVEH